MPITIEVYTRPFNSTAFPLSILQSYESQFKNYILNNYIQIKYDGGFINYYEDKPYYFWSCFDNKTKEKDAFTTYNALSSFVGKNIDEGYYVITYINEFFIPGREFYKKTDFLHDNLIYGYDSDSFYLLGYMPSGEYKPLKVLKKAYFESFLYSKKNELKTDVSNYLFCIRPKLDKQFLISLGEIKELLLDYLYCRNTSSRRCLKMKNRESAIYGVQCFKDYFAYIENNTEWDLRILRLFFEHKLLMRLRIETLTLHFVGFKKYIFEFEEIEKESFLIFQRTLKIFIMKEVCVIDSEHTYELKKIINRYKKLCDKEEHLLKKVLHEFPQFL